MKIHSEQEMMKFGESFSGRVLSSQFPPPCSPDGSARRGSPQLRHPSMNSSTVIELVGDVGAGKTTFVRGLAEGLGVKELVTSPSFTISKSYALPGGGNLVHYDFYRLSNPGLMAEDLYENINNSKNIVVVEWGESVKELLPEDHITVEIRYNDDNTREVNIK